jgi:hypothetical protein
VRILLSPTAWNWRQLQACCRLLDRWGSYLPVSIDRSWMSTSGREGDSFRRLPKLGKGLVWASLAKMPRVLRIHSPPLRAGKDESAQLGDRCRVESGRQLEFRMAMSELGTPTDMKLTHSHKRLRRVGRVVPPVRQHFFGSCLRSTSRDAGGSLPGII